MKKRASARFYRPSARPQPSQQTELEVDIAALSHDGRGIARHQGKTLFVAGALADERVRARIVESRSKFDQARCIEVLQASPQRREPACPHYQQCGGCELQHLDSEAQIQFKQQQALDQLQRLGGVSPEHILPPLDQDHWHYRQRARLSIYCPKPNSQPVLGFRRRNSQQLIAIRQCPVLESRAEALIPLLSDWLQQAQSPQALGHMELIATEHNLALLLRHPKPLAPADQTSLQDLCDAQQCLLFLQPGDDSSIHCPAKPGALLSYQLSNPDLRLQFSPADFTQINQGINQQMVSQALQLLAPTANDRVLDLFCGLGNFTLPLAAHAKEVIGVEGADAMVQRAAANAELNNIHNAHFYSLDLNDELMRQRWYQPGFDKVLLDPPRAGAQAVVEQLAKHSKADILYVSCNPATLARDAGILVQGGYRLRQWGVMNMFPQTTHVESMALFQR